MEFVFGLSIFFFLVLVVTLFVAPPCVTPTYMYDSSGNPIPTNEPAHQNSAEDFSDEELELADLGFIDAVLDRLDETDED